MNPLTSSLNSQTVLGILGSGQLARMTAMAASELGVETYIYCSEAESSPAEQVSSKCFKGSLKDGNAVLKFANECDFITLENEFIDQSILEAIEDKFPGRLFPTAKTFKKIGDKIREKEHFQKAGVRVVPFACAKSKQDVLGFAKVHGYPVVLKSAKGGYDGYGNWTLKSEKDLEEIWGACNIGEFLVEAFILYEKELAIMVARNKSGEMEIYPIAHTIQENHICHLVSVPAEISLSLENQIKNTAKLAMESLDAVGIFAFEFFLTTDGTLYLNESAPRPHNSGHYSIEGCVTSQFHNHVRSVLNLPLGKSTLRSEQILMLNLLGKDNAPSKLEPAIEFLKIDDGHLHLYGKKFSKPGRKMGHFTLLGNDKSKMLKIMQKLKMEYSL
jgi:5-(carboxyamino)imidazole ribonucleotide synthase